ncbi:hypothetical protein F4604DRAFT_1686107 [Suillus subluteus]|nr:hypothetical protein F4604DRAFT_1686107 [Suillus subluteus]
MIYIQSSHREQTRSSRTLDAHPASPKNTTMPIASKNHFWLDTRLDMFENQHSSGVGVIVAVAGTDGDENAACIIVSFRKKLTAFSGYLVYPSACLMKVGEDSTHRFGGAREQHQRSVLPILQFPSIPNLSAQRGKYNSRVACVATSEQTVHSWARLLDVTYERVHFPTPTVVEEGFGNKRAVLYQIVQDTKKEWNSGGNADSTQLLNGAKRVMNSARRAQYMIGISLYMIIDTAWPKRASKLDAIETWQCTRGQTARRGVQAILLLGG